MRVLIVDDEPDSVIPLEMELDRVGHRHWQCGFAGVQEALEDYTPDLVVLDLEEQGVQSGTGDAGRDAYENTIWQTHFCPVVVYSGFVERWLVEHSTLVKTVGKGGGSEALVLEAIEELRPYSDSISLVREQIDETARTTLRELMLAIADADGLDEARKQTLTVAMGRRRVAAYLDDPALQFSHLPESQYVYPVTGREYRFADVLRMVDSPVDSPASYLMVLTPSCDLCSHEGEPPNAEEVLVAKCLSVPLGERGLPGAPLSNKGKDKLGQLLQQGAHNGLVFLPKFLACLPAMCADLKGLNLIGPYRLVDGLCSVDGYERVVSVDSPFRERIAWSFMSTAARPGVPQIDIQRWVEMYA